MLGLRITGSPRLSAVKQAGESMLRLQHPHPLSLGLSGALAFFLFLNPETTSMEPKSEPNVKELGVKARAKLGMAGE